METPRKGPAGETNDTSRHRALGSASRATIMRLIRSSAGGLTAADIAAATGQHLSTTRAHLDRLVEAGLLVKARASGGMPGRPAWRYRATAADPAPAPYRTLAAALLDHLSSSTGDGDIRESAARVGQSWGRKLAAAAAPKTDSGDSADHTGPADNGGSVDPVDTVTKVLHGLGFDPHRQPGSPDGTGTQIHLRTCPFLDLVGQNPDAMCGLHAGVVRGVLEYHDAPDDAVLEPFGAPDACVVHLLPTRRRTGGSR